MDLVPTSMCIYCSNETSENPKPLLCYLSGKQPSGCICTGNVMNLICVLHKGIDKVTADGSFKPCIHMFKHGKYPVISSNDNIRDHVSFENLYQVFTV